MDVTVSLGEFVDVTVSDDTSYTPEVIQDLLKRAGDEALRLHRALVADAPAEAE